MRLLVISQYFWPENFRINDLVAELVRRGHHVSVLTGLPNYPGGQVFPEFRSDPAPYRSFAGAEVFRVPMLARGKGGIRLAMNYVSFALAATMAGPWLLRGRAIDAIFVFEPSPITVGLPAVVLRLIKRAPVAFWVLDLWPDTLQALGIVRSPALLGAIGKFVSFIYRRCDLILAQSRSFMQRIAAYSSPGQSIVYFPSWAEAVFDARSGESDSEQPAGSFDVLFAGNVGEAQDFPAILDAAVILRGHENIRWLIVGNGRAAGWVRQEIGRRGLDGRVLMLGEFPVDRMPAFYSQASVLLVSLQGKPVFSMTIPGKLQSYLAAGRPVVGMLDGEGADVIARAKAGRAVRAGDSAGLAAAVLELSRLSAKDLRAMGENALQFSRREFGRDLLISRLEALMQDMVRDARRVPGSEGG